MEVNEIDAALEDLEQRLERLRSLYEQYFLGIEKVEPAVARKDVDRRFWLMRRTKLRNTARRFRMQLLVQRYNTFQQYWLRICRQIENGTYSRHVRRAELKFGKEAVTIKAKRREKSLEKARENAALASRSSPLKAFLEGRDPPPGSAGPNEKPTVAAMPAVRAEASRLNRDSDYPSIEIHTRPTTRLPAIPARGSTPGPAVNPPPREPPRASPPTPAKVESGGESLSAQRVKELHSQLTAAQGRLADSSTVSLDVLFKSLKETTQKLQAIHGKGKNVDFRVVVKGGKAMVKPILR